MGESGKNSPHKLLKKENKMAEQDVLDKIEDNLTKLEEIDGKVDAINVVIDNILKRDMSLLYTCTECRGDGCETCDNTGLLPRVLAS